MRNPFIPLTFSVGLSLASNFFFYGSDNRSVSYMSLSLALLALVVASNVLIACYRYSERQSTVTQSLSPLQLGSGFVLGSGLVFLHEALYSLSASNLPAHTYSIDTGLATSSSFWSLALNLLPVLTMILLVASSAQLLRSYSAPDILTLGLPVLISVVLALPLGVVAFFPAALTALATASISLYLKNGLGLLLVAPLALAGLAFLTSLPATVFYSVGNYLHYPILALLAFTALVSLLALAKLVRVPNLTGPQA